MTPNFPSSPGSRLIWRSRSTRRQERTISMDGEISPGDASGFAHISPDIMEVVACHLHGNTHSLASLSLAGRRWTIPAQRQLFHSIRVVFGTNALRTYHSRPVITPLHRLPDLPAFLETTPHVRCFVKELLVISGWPATDLSVDPGSDFSILLEKLSALHTLILDEINLVMSKEGTSLGSPTSPPLSLRNFSCESLTVTEESLNALFSMCSPRGSALWRRFILSNRSRSLPLAPPAVPCTALKFSNFFKPWLQFPNLSTLHVSMERHDEFGAFFLRPPSFLAINGSRLSELRLEIHRLSIFTMLGRLPDAQFALIEPLSKVCPNLRRLFLTVTACFIDDSEEVYLPERYVRVIQAILFPAPPLMTSFGIGLSPVYSPFRLQTNTPEDDPVPNWKELSDLISRQPQLTLAKFSTVDHPSPTEMEGVLFDEDCEPLAMKHQDFLTQHLCVLKERGILVFN